MTSYILLLFTFTTEGDVHVTLIRFTPLHLRNPPPPTSPLSPSSLPPPGDIKCFCFTCQIKYNIFFNLSDFNSFLFFFVRVLVPPQHQLKFDWLQPFRVEQPRQVTLVRDSLQDPLGFALRGGKKYGIKS